MRSMIKVIGIVLLSGVLLPITVFAEPMTSGNYSLTTNVLDASGTHETSSSYDLYDVFVQSTPAGAYNSGNFNLNAGHIFTLLGIVIPPPAGQINMEVIVNGRRFLNGDIVPPNKPNDVSIKVIALAPVSTLEMYVDGTWINLSGPTGSPPDWLGTFTIIPQPLMQRHFLTFFASDEAGNASLVTMETTVLTGGVQVVGVPLNYPNPFRPLSGGSDSNTVIQYMLSDDAPVTIIMYDITGQEIRRWSFPAGMKNGGQAGVNQIVWDGRSMFGEVAGNGMYVYKIISGDKAIGTGKLVIRD